MTAADEILDFLYTTQLQVDDEWAVRTPNGFTWWAAGNAQTVEIIGEDSSPDGMTGHLMSVRTEMVSGLDLTEAALGELNAGPMQFASMSGPIYERALSMSMRLLDEGWDEDSFSLDHSAIGRSMLGGTGDPERN